MNNQNFVQPGRIVTLAAPYDRLTSGLGAKVGAIFGVSMDTVLSGVDGQFEREGVHTLAKTSAQAWTQGQRIFWDDSNKRCDSDGAVGMFIGCALEVADNPSSTGVVLLMPASQLLEGVQAAETAAAAAAAATAGGATPTAAQVDTGIATAVAPLVVTLNSLITKLEIAGILTPN